MSQQSTNNPFQFPTEHARVVHTPILRDGAQQMLAMEIESEVNAWIERHANQLDENSNRLVVRNGYQPNRTS